jgi:hypothetical protein
VPVNVRDRFIAHKSDPFRRGAGNRLKKENLILMRSTIRRLALVPGTVLAAGALILGTATAAGATVKTTDGWAGYRAGNGNWNFRYIQGTFVVPQHACTSDDYSASGVHLGGTIDFATVGVACTGSPAAITTYWAYNNGATSGITYGTTAPAADDTVFVSLYYNAANNDTNVYEYDETSGTTLLSTFITAGTALYKWASAFGIVNPSQPAPPPSGTSYTLVPFSQVRVTSYNGTRGTGINGPWGVQDEEAVNGAHVFAAGTNLSDGWGSFNVTEYGNA